MARELRGSRYLTAKNESLARTIVNELPFFDFDEIHRFYGRALPYVDHMGRALLGCNDRFFLLTTLMHRFDANHPWLFDRCREVEKNPDGYLDLWARYHFKSSIITFAGVIQEVLVDPELTVAIFSHSKGIAKAFLGQIKSELENNTYLKQLYSDVLWLNPTVDAPRWSENDGITIKRRGNPREATVEAWGLIDGQPISRHYGLLVYDDVVTEKTATNPDMIRKATKAWEMSDNLGTHLGVRKWHAGTRYCTIGSSRVLMGDWSHKPIADVRIGDTVVGWELRDGKRFLRRSRVVDRGVHFAQPVNRYALENGRSVTCTEDHKWWRGAHGGGPEYAPLSLPKGARKDRPPQGRRVNGGLVALRELLEPTERLETHAAGWLSGFFDGEGTVKKNKCHPSGLINIVQTMHNPGLIDETRRVLLALGFSYQENWHSPSAAAPIPSKPHLNQAGWKDRCVFSINGGWRERYRFLAEIAPARSEKISDTLFGQLKTERVGLHAIEPAGDQDVHWLETETGNYVVEGFCSSNSFGDTYGIILERKVLKERRYPATEDGQLTGKPVLLTAKRWAEVKDAQKSTVSAQMLLNPLAGNEAVFRAEWFRSYDVIPSVLNVYIMVDPSKGKKKAKNSDPDRTAIAVIGIDIGGNKYLLDGYCHLMRLSDRYAYMQQLRRKWEGHMGVQITKVGYEQFGAQSDIDVIEEYQERDGEYFEVTELKYPRQGESSKNARIERMEPDMRTGRFYFPSVVYHPDVGGRDGLCQWQVWTDDAQKKFQALSAEQGEPNRICPYTIGQIIHSPMMGPSRRQRYCEVTGQGHRIVKPIKRVNKDNDIYDLTRVFMEEARFFPFAPHDDLIDAASRMYDMEPIRPTQFEASSVESLEESLEPMHDA